MERWKECKKIIVPSVFCMVLAVILHQLFDWSHEALWAGIIAPANESVWEHGKILILPFALYSMLEFFICKPPFKAYCVAQTASLYFMPLAMTAFFYAYTGIVGHSILILDIISSFVWILLAFVISRRMMQSPQKAERWFPIAICALLLLIVAYICFSLHPPRIGLFQDPLTGVYGIPGIVTPAMTGTMY